MTYCPVAWGLAFLPTISLDLNEPWLESGFLTQNSPVGLGSDFITHNPLLCSSLALLPTIPYCLEFGSTAPNFFQTQNLSPLLPLQAWNRITHNAWRPSLTTEVGAQVSRAPFHLWRRDQPLRDGWPRSLTSSPAWGRHLLQPHGWVQAAPPLEGLGKAGGWGLGCLSVCLSLLTIEPNHCFQD